LAASILKKEGFANANVANLARGLLARKAADLPTDSGAEGKSMLASPRP
jgi:rhodanese-related sulfurtransferase